MVVIICFMGKDDNSMRIVLTIVGKDKVGIIAKVSNILAEHGVNILNMVLIADMTGAAVKLQDLKDIFTALGRDIGVEIRVQSEEIFTAMQRI